MDVNQKWPECKIYLHFSSYRRYLTPLQQCSRRLFENIVTKEEIAQNERFLLLPQCFPLLVIGYPFNYRDFLFFNKICSKSSAAEFSYEFNPFPQTDTFWRLCSRRLFENIVTKEEIAQNEQFLLLPQCLPLLVIGYPFNYRDFLFFWQNMIKVVCCRIVVWG